MTKSIIVLEYQLGCTPVSIYRAISTANGLREWFADEVDIVDDKYTFFWNKVAQVAYVVYTKENSFIRFRWEDDPNYFFEFRIAYYELTGDISLIVTDFTDVSESQDTVKLWDLQIRKLKRSIGCAKK